MINNNPMTQEELDAIHARLGCDNSTTDDVCTLLDEVERLRARLTVDDAMVERGVRAFYEHPTPGVDASLRPNWDRLARASPDVADKYRDGMTAALNVALGTGEGLV